jgi:hypothetical protein
VDAGRSTFATSLAGPQPGRVFIRYYVELPLGFGAVEEALLDAPVSWLPGLLRAAEDRGQHLLAEVGFNVDTRRIDKEVEIQIGEANRSAHVTALPMTWRATGAERLFPQLDADLEIAALGSGRTQLSISARYRAPLGPVGTVLDKALLHRVAEATLKDFVDGVAERVTELRAAV